jgi:hypothetical protein
VQLTKQRQQKHSADIRECANPLLTRLPMTST